VIILPGGRRLFWPFFHEVLSGYDELGQWRVIQEDSRHLLVQLVTSREDGGWLAGIEAELRRALPNEVALQIERVDRIATAPGEKRRVVLSRLSAPSRETNGESRGP
jgi:hypothetical protein